MQEQSNLGKLSEINRQTFAIQEDIESPDHFVHGIFAN